MKKYFNSNIYWFYRLLIIFILICLPFYGERLFLYRKAQPLQELTSLINSPDSPPSDSALFIGNDEDNDLLDKTLKTIFPEGYLKLSVEEKTIGVLRYASSLEHKNNAGNASKIIRDGYAICGGKDYVFRILLRKMGVPTRYVGLHYTPSQGGHDIAEVYFNNTWHLFDPTFGVFVYSKSSYDGLGKIFSMQEIRSKPTEGYLMQVSDEIWSGKFAPANYKSQIKMVEPGFLKSLAVDFNDY